MAHGAVWDRSPDSPEIPRLAGRNLREILSNNCDLADIVREERNYAALLYAALLDRPNAEAFLRRAADEQVTLRIDEACYGIYFEYAHLRDAWNCARDDQARVQAILRGVEIISTLGIDGLADLSAICSDLAGRLERRYGECIRTGGGAADFTPFNQWFVSRPSARQVQSPQTWQVAWLMAQRQDDLFDGLPAAARHMFVALAWCFNAKPDLVVHVNRDEAICVELKLESQESSYTATNSASNPFTLRQTEVQRVVMALLGFSRVHRVTVGMHSAHPSKDVKHLGWRELFFDEQRKPGGLLTLMDAPPFAQRMIDRLADR